MHRYVSHLSGFYVLCDNIPLVSLSCVPTLLYSLSALCQHYSTLSVLCVNIPLVSQPYVQTSLSSLSPLCQHPSRLSALCANIPLVSQSSLPTTLSSLSPLQSSSTGMCQHPSCFSVLYSRHTYNKGDNKTDGATPTIIATRSTHEEDKKRFKKNRVSTGCTYVCHCMIV